MRRRGHVSWSRWQFRRSVRHCCSDLDYGYHPQVPVSLSFSEFMAAMDNPLASRLNLSLDTTGVPPSIHPMLSSSPRPVRADGGETRLHILHWPITMTGGGVAVSIIWGHRAASISRSPFHIYPLSWQVPYLQNSPSREAVVRVQTCFPSAQDVSANSEG